MASEGGVYLPPVVASLLGDADSLARTLIGAKAMLEDFSKTPTTVNIRAEMTSIEQLQSELYRDISDLQAVATLSPIDLPVGIDFGRITAEAVAARASAENVLSSSQVTIPVGLTPLYVIRGELVQDLASVQAMASAQKVEVPVRIDLDITPLHTVQEELFQDLIGLQTLASSQPVEIPVRVDFNLPSLHTIQEELFKDLVEVQAMASAQPVEVPVRLDVDLTSLHSLQEELFKDIVEIQAMASAQPITLPVRLDMDLALTPLSNLQAEILKDIAGVQAVAAAQPVEVPVRIDVAQVAAEAVAAQAVVESTLASKKPEIKVQLTPMAALQTELFKDLGGLQAVAQDHPINIPMQLDMFKLISDTTEARMQVEDILNVPEITINTEFPLFSKMQLDLLKDIAGLKATAEADPVSIPFKLPALLTMQDELLRDIGGLRSLAEARPIDVPMQLDMFQILSETSAFRLFAEKPITVPIDPKINMAALAADRELIGAALGTAVGSSFWKAIFSAPLLALAGGLSGAGAGGIGRALGFGTGGGVGGGGWFPTIVPAGLPFLAGFGTIGGLMGFSVEHVLTTILGLAGSLTEAFAGMGVIAAGTFATMLVGMGSDMAVMRSTIADTRTLYGTLKNLEEATLLYGAGSAQAQFYTKLLNVQMLEMGNTAGVKAELGLAKLAMTINTQWDKATSNARVQAVGLLTSILELGQNYIPLVASAAAKNLGIINTSLVPLFAWLKGPQAMGIFTDLENKFAKNLPQAIDTFNQGIMFLLRFLDLASNYTSGFIAWLDRLFTYLNSPQGWSRVKKDVNDVIVVFHVWRDFIIILFKDIGDLLGQTVQVGTSMVQSLTGILTHLHDYLQSTSGKQAIGSLFEAHKQEILVLLQLLPKLVGPVAQVYLKLAVPLTNIATAVATIIDKLVSIPGAGPLLAYAAAIEIMTRRMFGLSAIMLAIKFAGVVNGFLAFAGAFRTFAAAEGIAAAATTAFGISEDVALAPILLIVAAIAILVLGIILLVTHWKEVSKVVQDVWKNVTHWVGQIVSDVGKFFSDLGSKVEKAWSNFAARPGYWIGFAIGFIAVKMANLLIDFDKWFAGIITSVIKWGQNMSKQAPGALGTFITAVMTEMQKLPGQVIAVGESIARGLWTGIQNLSDWLKKQIDGFISGLISGAMSALRSGSPSQEFADVGETIPQGLAAGVNRQTGVAMAALLSMFNQMNTVGAHLGARSVGGSGLALAGAGGHGPISLSAPISITMPAGSASNAQAVGTAVQRALEQEFDHLITRLQGGVYSTPGS